MACAASAAFLNVLESIDLETVRANGRKWKEALEGHSVVQEVRGSGHFLGVDLDGPERVARLVEAARRRSMILFWFLSRPQGFRIAPPLIASKEALDRALRALLESLDEVQ